MYAGLEDSTFQHSSPLRHATELKQILVGRHTSINPIISMHTDGGVDHRLTYMLVQIALIVLFIELDLDFLYAIRTAPHNSWKNPAERIMSILNLVFPGVGIARGLTAFDEDHLQGFNNMKQIRELTKTVPDLESGIFDSLERPKAL